MLPLLSSVQIQLALRRSVATIGSVLIHLLLLYFLANKLLGSGDGSHSGLQGEKTLVFNLNQEAADPGSKARADPKDKSQATPPTPAVQPPLEWKVTRLPHEVSQAVATAEAHNFQATPATKAAGNAGGGNYDPYAGAAPEKLGMNLANLSLKSLQRTGQVILDADKLQKLKALIAKSRQSHTIQLTISIAKDGRNELLAAEGCDIGLKNTIAHFIKTYGLFSATAELEKIELRTASL